MADTNAMLVYMRRLLGDENANVSLARNIIAPVASKLSAGGDLHRRCVLFDCAPSRVRIEDVCAVLAPSGDIEAVALCGYLVAAVVVFRTAAGAARALRGPEGRSCHEILLPLDLGIELPVIVPTHVKIMSDSPMPQAANPGNINAPEAGCASTLQPPPEPRPGEPVTTRREEEEPAPWFEFHDPSKAEAFELCEAGIRMRPGTWFIPSADSLVRGPTHGADGSLWMHGDTYTKGTWGFRVDDESIRVKRIDPPPEAKQRGRVPDHAIWFAPL